MTEQEQAQFEVLSKKNNELLEANATLTEENSELLAEKEKLSGENEKLVAEAGVFQEDVEKLEHTIKSLSGKLKKVKKGVKDGPPIVRH